MRFGDDSIDSSSVSATSSPVPCAHNVEGMDAIVVLNRLREIDYEFADEPSNETLGRERFEITVYKGFIKGIFPEDTFTIAQERYGHQAKKWTKQCLASKGLALDLMVKHEHDEAKTNFWAEQ
jgi:hypothetical protein